MGPDLLDDCSLCPVRALKVYLSRKRVCMLISNSSLLHCWSFPGHLQEHCFWMGQETHQRGYHHPNRKACELTNYNTRDIRDMAASWASRGTLDLEGLMKACTWKSHTTFSDFYLKDMSVVREGLLALGLIVAAQSTIHPSCH